MSHSQWTSEYAILRDLSVAQGRVPVRIDKTVGPGEKPPSLDINEETEEDFFTHCSGDTDFTAAPDFAVIQQMLDMVRDHKCSSDEEDYTDKAIVISKLNSENPMYRPLHNNMSTPREEFSKKENKIKPDKDILKTKLNPETPIFIPLHKNTSTPIELSPKKENNIKQQKKRQRNIALESILQGIAETGNRDVVLLKPHDFITANDIHGDVVQKSIPVYHEDPKALGNSDNMTAPTATEKVNGWFQTQTTSPFPEKIHKVILEASDITYKKKEISKEKLRKSEKSITLSSRSNEYKPSPMAEQYYLKFVQRNKFKESFKENLWTKAEKKMKEIEDKRQREAAHALTSPSNTSHSSEPVIQSFEETQSTDAYTARIMTEIKLCRGVDFVVLPQHRHSLPEVCIVCEVMSKKRDVPIKSVMIKETEDSITNENATDDKSETQTFDADAPVKYEESELLLFKECVGNKDFSSYVETADLFSQNILNDDGTTDLTVNNFGYLENINVNTKVFESDIECAGLVTEKPNYVENSRRISETCTTETDAENTEVICKEFTKDEGLTNKVVTTDAENADIISKKNITDVDNTDLINKTVTEYVENISLVSEEPASYTDLVEFEFTEDVKNVYDCVFKTENIPHYESCLSDQSF